MNVNDGLKDISHPDAPGFVDVEVSEIPEYVFTDILRADPTDDDTRSQTLAFRFPNGDLVLGFYPQGDTYFKVVDDWGV